MKSVQIVIEITDLSERERLSDESIGEFSSELQGFTREWLEELEGTLDADGDHLDDDLYVGVRRIK